MTTMRTDSTKSTAAERSTSVVPVHVFSSTVCLTMLCLYLAVGMADWIPSQSTSQFKSM
jgi:hypothetical protein